MLATWCYQRQRVNIGEAKIGGNDWVVITGQWNTGRVCIVSFPLSEMWFT